MGIYEVQSAKAQTSIGEAGIGRAVGSIFWDRLHEGSSLGSEMIRWGMLALSMQKS